MAQEGFGDGDESDDWCDVLDHRVVKVVSQVRQDGDVLRFGFGQIRRGQAQHAAENKEHHGQHHHDVCIAQDAGTFLLSVHAVLFAFCYSKGGDDRRVVEREHHNRDCQPQGDHQAVAQAAARTGQ
ncbi:hypothetical protein D3C80_1780490 [compost metagenome]